MSRRMCTGAVLTREEIVYRLSRAHAREHPGPEARPGSVPGDEGALGTPHAAAPLPAAVLVGLVDRPDGPALLLTQRTEHLRDHAGQICFPGGRIEADDAGATGAALREAEEEIGLPPERVAVLGELPTYQTITGFRIHPVVGWVSPPFELRPDPFEVAEVFEVPLHFVTDPENHRRQSYRRGSLTRGYYVLPYQGRFIWGATAGILVNLARTLGT
jgi:8-oxo-dGTP pyrophosphatase MutT (NUDIX family)